MTDVALGEIFLVGAVPIAMVFGMIGGILSKRYRRTALAVAGCGLLLMVLMLVAGRRMIAPLSEMRAAQKERFAPVEIGQTREMVREAIGAPDLTCPREGYVAHKARGSAELETRLYAATTERWIYYIAAEGSRPDEGREGCQPLYGEGEVGFHAGGEVLWYIPLTGDTFLTF